MYARLVRQAFLFFVILFVWTAVILFVGPK